MIARALLLGLSLATVASATWQDRLGDRPFLYSPDYVDPYDYFVEEGNPERLTETIKVAFPQEAASRKGWKVSSISYRSVLRDGKPLEPTTEAARGLMERMGLSKPGFPIQETLVDDMARPWSMYTWFSPRRDRLYCTILPEAYVCFAANPDSPLTSDQMYHAVLSQAYVQNPYWRWVSLERYLREGAFHPVLADVDLSRLDSRTLRVHLKSLGVSYDFQGDPQKDMLRVTGALVREGRKSRWIAFGLHHLSPSSPAFSVEFSGEKNDDLRDHFEAYARAGKRPEAFTSKRLGLKLKTWKTCAQQKPGRI